MRKFLLKRLGVALIVLFGVSVIVFTLIHLQPGNPYLNMIDPSMSPDVVEQKLRELGYYDPIYIQYMKWIGRAITGDFGYSTQFNAPVFSIILDALGNTILISVASFIVSSVLAIVIGIITAEKSGTWVDYLVTVLSFIGISIPTFFFALILIKIFGYDLAILPSSGMETLTESYTGIAYIFDVIKHMILPVTVLSLTQTATLIRYTRSSMLDALSQDYMRTAQAKGLTRKQAIWTHGLRNSLISIVTVLCLQLPTLVSGALITETVFVWPGIGTLNYNAIMNRDYMLIMGITMMIAVVIVIANILADVLYAVVDPRIKVME
ncbi:ABC transporter permease [Peptacetobacter hominis]|uniref:ABC transporter permease n=1 Tax=Peptacetobacter hominis TaxID=2743610 RepID=A0A544QTQ3_9FIRM|nr:ABC transporter permease [Peptacetobacter hominis]TQQ84076.1 ABC transporter permease [Peptacetobacter hominis]